ncbi:MAG: PLP-dependent transferase [Puniceicoccales bacterium]|nr:PLP-dependent transferase [Puniceicoccales bacterium]
MGARIPGCEHSVIVSLPTMADVIGYEERAPETMDKVHTGYPRFVRHPFIAEAVIKLAEHAKLGARALYPLPSVATAQRIVELSGQQNDYGIIETDGWVLLHLTPNDPQIAYNAAKLIQHMGVSISSRQAEDWLVAHGYRDAVESELLSDENPANAVAATLAPLLSPAKSDDILLCRAGMNAFYAAFEATLAIQRPRGRNLWLQLGWLYADTTSILQKCLRPDESFVVLSNVLDQSAIEKFFAENGSRIAGVITEAPTNPLVRTADIVRLSEIAQRYGAVRIFDPSICGLTNVDLLPHCDILVNSLTKYAAHKGDVLAGAVALNPDSPYYSDLKAAATAAHSPAYSRDIARLAAQIGNMPTVSAQINKNTMRLASWLEGHSGVRRISWAYSSASAKNYSTIARGPEMPGCMISIELKKPVATFYDRLQTPKGPSFGTEFTLVSPYIYLAHYDKVSCREGRGNLLSCGIDPELIRISVGAEPYEKIESVFAEVLA